MQDGSVLAASSYIGIQSVIDQLLSVYAPETQKQNFSYIILLLTVKDILIHICLVLSENQDSNRTKLKRNNSEEQVCIQKAMK